MRATFINEKLNIKDGMAEKAILFTDIVKSAELWLKSPEDMIEALEKQSNIFKKITDKHKGEIIKTLGDAYMISFKDLETSIEFAIELQKELKKKALKVGNKKIEIRIGICYGEVHESLVNVQNKNLVDYLGVTVNTAARIESNVCEPGEIVFSSLIDTDLENILDNYKVDVTKFRKGSSKIKRSERLLTDVQRRYYKDVKDLKGIEEIEVYKIRL